MNPNAAPTRGDRMLGGLWGSVVGDALGVPVEFRPRMVVQAAPVTSMRGFGTHDQPPGTWSDDSSLLLCATESLVCADFDTSDMGQRFVRWLLEGHWTPHGHVFDVGTTTNRALKKIAAAIPAELAGGDDESSNGNGSLMRILPVALRFANAPLEKSLQAVHRSSAITHRHPRAQMACGFFALVVRRLLEGAEPAGAFRQAMAEGALFYKADTRWWSQLEEFRMLFSGELAQRNEVEIDSGGYVVDTLTASLWCLLTTRNFSECVLKAVNLGGDTDTTGCVAGGLAGLCYGIGAIPNEWIAALSRHDEIAGLFDRFAASPYLAGVSL